MSSSSSSDYSGSTYDPQSGNAGYSRDYDYSGKTVREWEFTNGEKATDTTYRNGDAYRTHEDGRSEKIWP